ncbi:MAG: type II toxin-antitoxin system VapC family toxin [Nitrososphaerota archaeon]|nr:type II toxin-antitoxin system VapC family toxin [Nitrososphaerota archaeon]MDG7025613.1 type II toxin-antitoxin system VapC family toxin [Nitrososphaerota archaeon]
MISVDSYGWIERFTSGPKAPAYNRLIDAEKPEDLVTSVVVLYEVYKKVKGIRGEEKALEAVAALSQTKVVVADQRLSLEAADYSLEHGLHMADALVYAAARQNSAVLYTSDEDLEGLPGVTLV